MKPGVAVLGASILMLSAACGQSAELSTRGCPVETSNGSIGSEGGRSASPKAALAAYLQSQPHKGMNGNPMPAMPTDTSTWVERHGVGLHRIFFHATAHRADFEVIVYPVIDGGWGVGSVSVCR